jgi:tetratricopeptide (TPR) repeat protein
MDDSPDSWERRLSALWASLPQLQADVFRAEMAALVRELPEASAVGLFELGSAQDSTGRSDLAIPFYRSALAAGLTGLRRRRATIQLASSLRNTGQYAQAEQLLEQEAQHAPDELSDAVTAFWALVLSDLGREREGLGRALLALSFHLPRYNASLGRYAAELVADGSPDAADRGPRQ